MTSIHPSKRPTGRKCGSCLACCQHLKIESRPGYSTLVDSGEDIAKPAGEPCRFLVEGRCSVYDRRPAVCRNFFCDWVVARQGFDMDDDPITTRIIGVRGMEMKF